MLDINKFGTTPSGDVVEKYTLNNERGITVELITFGATILSIKTPDCGGNIADITIGFDNLDDYLTKNHHFGSVVGRYANRIAGAAFKLHGVTYHLEANNGRNHIHGGSKALDKYVWNAHAVEKENSTSVIMQHVSPAGDMGFPGALSVQIAYTLDRSDTLTIDYYAVTDAPTVLNLTNHTYFNLSGKIGTPVYDHNIIILSDLFLPIDSEGIPLPDSPAPVDGTVMDFRNGAILGDKIHTRDEQLILAGGYDHTYLLSKDNDKIMRQAAALTHPVSGRSVSMATSEPSLQFYTSNTLDGQTVFRNDIRVPKHGAITLEAQHFPDSPNRPDFPSTLLLPEHTYTQKTKYTFNKVVTSCNRK